MYAKLYIYSLSIWLKYCRYGVKPYNPINQSINNRKTVKAVYSAMYCMGETFYVVIEMVSDTAGFGLNIFYCAYTLCLTTAPIKMVYSHRFTSPSVKYEFQYSQRGSRITPRPRGGVIILPALPRRGDSSRGNAGRSAVDYTCKVNYLHNDPNYSHRQRIFKGAVLSSYYTFWKNKMIDMII